MTDTWADLVEPMLRRVIIEQYGKDTTLFDAVFDEVRVRKTPPKDPLERAVEQAISELASRNTGSGEFTIDFWAKVKEDKDFFHHVFVKNNSGVKWFIDGKERK